MKSSRKISFWIVFCGILSLQASCKSAHVGGSKDCPKKDVEILRSELEAQLKIGFDFYYSRVKVSIKDSQTSNSFTATVKMKPDSAFAGTIKVAGILGAAYLIDVDSVSHKQKLKKCFKKESYTSLSETFGTEVNYNFMQQLVLGQAVGINQTKEFYPIKEADSYVIATHDKKAFQRLASYNLKDEEFADVFVKYTLDCEDMQLRKIEIHVPKDAVIISIKYLKRQDVEGFLLPEETAIKIISPKDSVFIDLNYSKTSVNSYKKINLSIPDSYSECK
jgi:Domain of unknown function (DUF4292)